MLIVILHSMINKNDAQNIRIHTHAHARTHAHTTHRDRYTHTHTDRHTKQLKTIALEKNAGYKANGLDGRSIVVVRSATYTSR